MMGALVTCRLSVLLLALFILTVYAISKERQEIEEMIRSGSREELSMFIDNNPSVLNAIGGGGQTPLMSATLQGKHVAVQVLLEKGADVNIGEKDGYTPLHGAGFQGRAQVAKLLLSHGLDPKKHHSDGFTAFHRACWGKSQKHTDTVREFLNNDHTLLAHRSLNDAHCYELAGSEETKEMLLSWRKEHRDKHDPNSYHKDL